MREMIRAIPALAAASEKWVPPFFDRTAALSRLRTSIARRESLLISGPAGIGKTALMAKLCSELPIDVARATIFLSGVEGLRPFLHSLLRKLYDAGDATLHRQLRREGFREGELQSWLKSLSASRLRGALYRSMENGQYWIVHDHVPPLTRRVADVAKELVRMHSTPVLLLARGLGHAHVGHVADLYWADEHRLSLGPLPKPAAGALLESCIRRFALERFELQEFRNEVLRLSGLVPGSLIKMCALAAQPRYQYGSQIKTKLIHIDSLVSAYKPKGASQDFRECLRWPVKTRR